MTPPIRNNNKGKAHNKRVFRDIPGSYTIHWPYFSMRDKNTSSLVFPFSNSLLIYFFILSAKSELDSWIVWPWQIKHRKFLVIFTVCSSEKEDDTAVFLKLKQVKIRIIKILIFSNFFDFVNFFF